LLAASKRRQSTRETNHPSSTWDAILAFCLRRVRGRCLHDSTGLSGIHHRGGSKT